MVPKDNFLVSIFQYSLSNFANMKKARYNVIGVMSGTSLDGIDIIYVEFEFGNKTIFKILESSTIPYPQKWRNLLTDAINYCSSELEEFNIEYTRYLGDLLVAFIQTNKIKNLDLIASHGHTIHHRPEEKYTLQIGNLPELASNTRENIVCDFRVQDVQFGGQGAPLVPIGDRLLFSEYEYCLNLGGFANVSSESKSGRVAYDICAVNTVLNYYSQQLGMEYDRGGKVASRGTLNKTLLKELNALSFYEHLPPKSLGIEWVNNEIFPVLKNYEEDIPSVLHTYTVHIAEMISKAFDNSPTSKVLVTGGGAFNDFLMTKIREYSKNEIVIPSQEIINFKEALIFALLGVLKVRDEINVLSSVTGAKKDHSSGVIYKP